MSTGKHIYDSSVCKSITNCISAVLASSFKQHKTNNLLVPAAILMLVYPKGKHYCLLLNKRSQLVEHHKGEVSFPGGTKELFDKTMLDTALRETSEEMGIAPDDIVVLGELDDVETHSNSISPFVGTIRADYEFNVSEREVEKVLEIPVGFLCAKENQRDDTRIVDGEVLRHKSYMYEGHLIFGATAEMITTLLDLLGRDHSNHYWRSYRR